MPSGIGVGFCILPDGNMRRLGETKEVHDVCRGASATAPNRSVSIVALALSVFLLPLGSTMAQVVGPALERHTLEFGVTYKWYERDFDTMYVGQEDWSAGALYFKFGACRWATVSIEGGISTVNHDDFPGTDYKRYTIGAGLTSLLYDGSGFRVEAAGHYGEIFDHDRSDSQFHKNTRGVVVAVQFEGVFVWREQEILLWAGPAFVYDQVRQYPWRSYEPIKGDTSNKFGIVIGTNLLLFDRVDVFVNGVYADAFQPRLGAGIQF